MYYNILQGGVDDMQKFEQGIVQLVLETKAFLALSAGVPLVTDLTALLIIWAPVSSTQRKLLIVQSLRCIWMGWILMAWICKANQLESNSSLKCPGCICQCCANKRSKGGETVTAVIVKDMQCLDIKMLLVYSDVTE